MIVVDVGAMRQGPEESVHKLIDRFRPDVLFAFDPHPDFVEGVERISDTIVVSRRAAAWTHGRGIPLRVDGITTGLAESGIRKHDYAESVDLPAWLRTLPATEIVLKLDAEGSEYPLLHALSEQLLDNDLALVLVEWHPPETAHGMFTETRPTLRCPVEEWM